MISCIKLAFVLVDNDDESSDGGVTEEEDFFTLFGQICFFFVYSSQYSLFSPFQ
jgi:hypothetical protein